jgi:hypothetical protein
MRDFLFYRCHCERLKGAKQSPMTQEIAPLKKHQDRRAKCIALAMTQEKEAQMNTRTIVRFEVVSCLLARLFNGSKAERQMRAASRLPDTWNLKCNVPMRENVRYAPRRRAGDALSRRAHSYYT